MDNINKYFGFIRQNLTMSYSKTNNKDPFVKILNRFTGHLCHYSPIQISGEVAMSSFLHEQNQIFQWLEEEAIARVASTKSIDPTERDRHYVRAEHYADYAWSLAETNDHAFIPSEIWHSNPHEAGQIAAYNGVQLT